MMGWLFVHLIDVMNHSRIRNKIKIKRYCLENDIRKKTRLRSLRNCWLFSPKFRMQHGSKIYPLVMQLLEIDTMASQIFQFDGPKNNFGKKVSIHCIYFKKILLNLKKWKININKLPLQLYNVSQENLCLLSLGHH